MKVEVSIDGVAHTADVEPRLLLVEWLRSIGKTGTHVGCDTSSCGACTVLLDGSPVKSCTLFTVQAEGTEVVTIHGLTPPEGLSPIQQAFADEHGLQCGFCTPGLVVATRALLDQTPRPDDDEIVEALDGNLCRCTGYTSIMRAVRRAAHLLAGEDPEIEAGRSHADPLARHSVEGSAVFEDLGDTEVV